MILIDGYNLLHAIGIAERKIGPGTLDRSRKALLAFLAKSLSDDDRSVTTVVFDSQDAPAGLPRELQHQGMTVRYSVGYESADELLEELIQAATTPKKMIVVSNDHRVQRAATRRRAQAIDSEVWYEQLCAGRTTKDDVAPARPTKPSRMLSQDEVNHWLGEFADIEIEDLVPRDEKKPADLPAKPIENPFPPGYGEDLLDEKRLQNRRKPEA